MQTIIVSIAKTMCHTLVANSSTPLTQAKRISDSVYVFLLDVSCMSVPPPSPSQACSWAHPVQSTSTRNHKIRVSVVCCEPRYIATI